VLLAALTLAPGLTGATAAVQPSLCKIRHPSDGAIEWTCRRLQGGETLERAFGERWIDVARFNRLDRRHARPSIELKVPVRLDDVKDFTPMPLSYPAAQAEAKFVLVDLSEQFLGAYERGRLVFSSPAAAGEPTNRTPTGDFTITAADPRHPSSLYTIEGTNVPYPMTWALRFHINPAGVAFWIHGRDLAGYPVSHGCVGLYDERMQKQYYGDPAEPVLEDARRLYAWVTGDASGETGQQYLGRGPRVRITGASPATD
jgi:hypothetical protein